MSTKISSDIKKIWHWIWNSDSFLSWIIALILIFLFVKFIFFPTLSLLMGTPLPLAGVESSSMDHQVVKDERGTYTICGHDYGDKNRNYKDFNEYWNICGKWYEDNGITKEKFSQFQLKNGFKKGDIVIVWGRFKPKVGDIIIFKPNEDSLAPRPIVHRIVRIQDGVIETKGDHNEEQLHKENNIFRTDESNISEDQVIGKVIFKVPYLGWFKIWFVELLKLFL